MAELPNLKKEKNEMPMQDPAVRARNFEEVALGYDEATAIDEAKRCSDGRFGGICYNHE